MYRRHMIMAVALVALVGLSCERASISVPNSEATSAAKKPAPARAPAKAAPIKAPAKAAPPAAASDQAPAREVASFSTPGLDATLARKLAGALAALPGVIKATPAMADKRFDVEFVPGKTAPAKMLAALKTVSPSVALEGVRDPGPAAANSGSKCGGCPMKDTCGKK